MEDDMNVPHVRKGDYRKHGLRYIGNKRQLVQVPIVFAIIINVFLPGIGVMFTGKPGSGYFQFLSFCILLYAFISSTVLVKYIAVILFVPLWIWSLTSVLWMPMEKY